MSIDARPMGVAGRRRLVNVPVMLLVVALLVAAFACGYGLSRATGGAPRLVQGVVTSADPDGRTIGFVEDGGQLPGESMTVDITTWTDKDGKRFNLSIPTCMRQGSLGQRAQLGIVELPTLRQNSAKVVVSVRCLS
jgi:hypothetical protein